MSVFQRQSLGSLLIGLLAGAAMSHPLHRFIELWVYNIGNATSILNSDYGLWGCTIMLIFLAFTWVYPTESSPQGRFLRFSPVALCGASMLYLFYEYYTPKILNPLFPAFAIQGICYLIAYGCFVYFEEAQPFKFVKEEESGPRGSLGSAILGFVLGMNFTSILPSVLAFVMAGKYAKPIGEIYFFSARVCIFAVVAAYLNVPSLSRPGTRRLAYLPLALLGAVSIYRLYETISFPFPAYHGGVHGFTCIMAYVALGFLDDTQPFVTTESEASIIDCSSGV